MRFKRLLYSSLALTSIALIANQSSQVKAESMNNNYANIIAINKIYSNSYLAKLLGFSHFDIAYITTSIDDMLSSKAAHSRSNFRKASSISSVRSSDASTNSSSESKQSSSSSTPSNDSQSQSQTESQTATQSNDVPDTQQQVQQQSSQPQDDQPQQPSVSDQNSQPIFNDHSDTLVDTALTLPNSSNDVSTPLEYDLSQFQSSGVINWRSYKFTYYSESVLPGYGLQIPGRHVNADGYVVDAEGYIVLANDSPIGSIIDTPFGHKGKVYDRGTYGNHYDVYIR